MPMAAPDHYVAMLDRAMEGGFAYPANQRDQFPSTQRCPAGIRRSA
jgi:hypothetical protein